MATKPPAKKAPAKAPAKKAPTKPPAKKAPAKKTPVKKVEEDELPTHPPEPEEEIPEEVPEIPEEEIPEVPTEEVPEVPPEEKKEKIEIDKEQLVGFIDTLIDILTFKRVWLVALLTIIAIVIYSLYENRAAIVQRFTGPRVVNQAPQVTQWELSTSSKANLQALARTTDVSFIGVTDVDLQKNRRNIRYFYIDDPAIRLSPAAQQALTLPQAVFDYDSKNTTQMVSVLSNEFRCDNYQDTIYFRYAPEQAEVWPIICRLAIPPFVGQFVGFITVSLRRPMTKSELDSIRLEVSRLAVDIYLNDVIKNPDMTVPAPN